MLIGTFIFTFLVYGLLFVSSWNWITYFKIKFLGFEKALASFCLFFTFIIGSILLLGIIGKLELGWFLTLIVLYSLLSRPRILSLPQHIGSFWNSLLRIEKLYVLVWLLLQIYCLVFIINFPPFTNDGLGYHIPNIAKWYQEQRIHQIASPQWAANALPMNQEYIALSTVLLMGNDLLVELGHFLFLPMLVFAVYGLSYQLGKNKSMSLLAGLGVSVTPAFFLQSVTNMSDYALFTLGLTAMYWVVKWIDSPSLIYSIFAALALGMAVGTKPQGLHILFVLMLLAFVNSIVKKVNVNKFLEFCVICAVGVILLGSFTYLKNFYYFKNPFFPFEVSIFGFTIHNPPGAYQLPKFGASVLHLSMNLKAIISQVIKVNPHYHPDLALINGWGWWALIPGIFLGISAFKRSPTYRNIALPILVYVLLAISSIVYQPGNARYIMIIIALPYVALGTLGPLVKSSVLKTLLVGSLLLQMITTLALTYRFGILDRNRVQIITGAPLLKRSAYLMMPDWYTKVGSVQKLPLNEAVGYFGEQNELNYILYEPTLTRKVFYIQPTNQIEIEKQLTNYHLKYIVMEPTSLYFPLIKYLESSGKFIKVDNSYLYEYKP